MITCRQGNLLEADVDAIVNTVNTVGVMGKGIALMFKDRYPKNYRAYAAACKAGEVRTGQMFVTAANELGGPRWIINFPTKQHWRNPSRREWIENGLQDLVRVIREKEIHSYVWLKDYDFAVILERQTKRMGDIFMLITSFLVTHEGKRKDLQSRYERRIK